MPHGFVQLPPDGAGKKLHTHEIDTGEHNQVFSLGDSATPDNLQTVDEYGAAKVRFDEGGMIFDGYGKAKISEETTLSNFTFEYDELSNHFYDDITGTGSVVYSPNERGVRHIVDIGATDKVTRTSHRYHKYVAGASQYIVMAVTPGAPKPGVVKRWGYFDDLNGVFFEQNDVDAHVVIRSNATGTPVDTKISRDNFNEDSVDGTGLSGILLNPEYSNVFWIDLQWGVGRVRFGILAPDGHRVVLHSFKNANITPTMYMETGSLPLRTEIFNTGVTSSSTELKLLNSAVVTDADNRYEYTTVNSLRYGMATPVDITNTLKDVFTIRMLDVFKGKVNRGAAIPAFLSIHTDVPIMIFLFKNSTLVGGETWSTRDSEAIVEYSIDAVTSAAGSGAYCTVLPAGTTKFELTDIFDYQQEYLKMSADGINSDTYTCQIRTLDALAEGTVLGGMCWKELRM